MFADELIDALVEETQGYPYFLQFYPYFLIQNIPKKRIGTKEFKEMYPLLLRELDDSFFSGRFNRASDGEQRMLFEMARLGGNTDLIQSQFNHFTSIPFPPFYSSPFILFPEYLV